MSKNRRNRPPKPPIRWTGILFAAAMNVMLVTLAQFLINWLGLSLNFELLATLFAPVAAGALTHYYLRERAGIHAFIGGLISIPILTFLAFSGVWQFGVLAGAFCGLSGALAEIITRPRNR